MSPSWHERVSTGLSPLGARIRGSAASSASWRERFAAGAGHKRSWRTILAASWRERLSALTPSALGFWRSAVSPSWCERLIIGLAPSGVQFARYTRGVRPRLVEYGGVGCAESSGEPWRAVMEALARELQQRGVAKRTCQVVLSNHFLRYQMVPWRPEINKRRERAALAQAQYRAVFGEAARGWSVRLADAGYGAPALACAVDEALVQELDRLLRQSGAGSISIEPYPVAAINLWRHDLTADSFWLVLLEPGRLWLGRAEGGNWVGVATRRLAGDAPAETLASLAQEAAVIGGDVFGGATYCVASGLDNGHARALREAGLNVLSAEPFGALCLACGRTPARG